MEQWTPAAEGTNFELPPILKPLEPFQKQLTIVSGLENKPAIAPPVHALNPGTWLSCVTPRVSQEPYGGITVDQIAAQHIGQDTPLPVARSGDRRPWRRRRLRPQLRLQLRRHDLVPHAVDAAADGIRSAQAVRAAVRPGRHAAGARRRSRRQYASILDLVRRQGRRPAADARRGRPRACSATTSRACARSNGACRRWRRRTCRSLDLPDVPVGHRRSTSTLNLMFDMLALAYQANLTRVFTLHDGGRGQQHDLQPRRRVRRVPSAVASPERQARASERLVRIQTYHTQAFAKFLAKLAAMPDGDGSMLDHSILALRQQHEQQQRARPVPAADARSSAAAAARSRAAST